MEISPKDVREEFKRADRGGRGYLFEGELQGMLRTLGVRLTSQRLQGFMDHIGAVRPPGQGMNTGRPYLTLNEFMNNRASFGTLEVPASRGRATMYTDTSRNIMAGLPPKKANECMRARITHMEPFYPSYLPTYLPTYMPTYSASSDYTLCGSLPSSLIR